jgi:PAS domain S-box-containing protein
MRFQIRNWIASYIRQPRKPDVAMIEKKQTGEDALKSEDKFVILFSLNPSPMALIKASDWSFFDVNEAFTEVLGYLPSEVVGYTPDEIRLFVNRSTWSLIQRRVNSDNVLRKYQAEVFDRSGTTCIMILDGALIEFNYEKYLLVSVYDFTNRIKAEQTLIYNKQLEHILTNISTSFIKARPNEIDTCINAALNDFGTFLALSRSSVYLKAEQGSICFDLAYVWHADKKNSLAGLPARIPLSQLPHFMDKLILYQPVHIPNVNKIPDNNLTEEELHFISGVESVLIIPLFNKNELKGFLRFDSGETDGYSRNETFLFMQNLANIFVSELIKKENEVELEKYRQYLEEIIKERTEALGKMEQGLRQAEKLQAIGTLAGGIAHDFNNILQIIQLYSDLLSLELNANPSALKNLSHISKSIDRGKDLILKILTFSRQKEDEISEQNITHVVNDAISFINKMIPSTTQVVIDIRECGMVLCNPINIQQIIMNLVTNAIHAIQNKGLISIRLEKIENPVINASIQKGSWIKLSVTDNGKGMDAQTQTRIFEPFFTTKEVGQGTGLGLSTVLGNVQAHSGLIEVESTLGKGSNIHIFLPAFLS